MNSETLAREVIFRLRSSGHQAWLVGGCVRDLLLGVKPKDYDVATDALPGRIADLFPGSGQVGAQFGVVLVRRNGAQVEVATFRSDDRYSDGRRPDTVHFEAAPRADAMRRDFTINGLMLDPSTGELLDYVGGRADLEGRVIRAIGDPDARFREDHLRLLRAVRFAARLTFSIHPATMEAIRRNRERIARVAAERVRDELVRILTEGGARRGFQLLDESGLLREILPEVAAMKGVAQPPEFHPEGDVWVHTLGLLERLEHPSATLALGALLHDVGKPPTSRVAERIRFDGHVEQGLRLGAQILARLRCSNDQAERVEALIANHMRFADATRMRESTLKRFLRLPHFDEHLTLHRLDCMAAHGNLDNYDFVQRRRREIPEEEIKPVPLVGGADLIAAGYTPGPPFALMLAAVEEAQLEGRVSSKEEGMHLVFDRFGKPARPNASPTEPATLRKRVTGAKIHPDAR